MMRRRGREEIGIGEKSAAKNRWRPKTEEGNGTGYAKWAQDAPGAQRQNEMGRDRERGADSVGRTQTSTSLPQKPNGNWYPSI